MSPASRSGSTVGCTTMASPTSTRCRTMSGPGRSTVFRSIGHPRCWGRLGTTTRMGGIMPVGRYFLSLAVLAAASLASLPALAQTAKASLKDTSGKDVGQVALLQPPHGVLLKLTVKGVPAGEHAFHVHAVGKCEPPFTSAGGHFNPGNKKHGMMSPEGQHAGDMPNLHIPASGALTVDVVNSAITLEKGKGAGDANGLPLIIHAGKDDYKTDPTGDAG